MNASFVDPTMMYKIETEMKIILQAPSGAQQLVCLLFDPTDNSERRPNGPITAGNHTDVAFPVFH
jgi:hypothetical protein